MLKRNACCAINMKFMARKMKEANLNMSEGELLHFVNFPAFEVTELYDSIPDLFDRFTPSQHDEIFSIIQASRKKQCDCARCSTHQSTAA